MGRTLADDIASDVAAVVLNTNDFAKSVIHQPFGGEPVPVDAIYTEHPPPNTSDDSKGERQSFTADLMIGETDGETVTAGRGSEISKFVAGGHVWRAVGMSAGNGSVIVRLERNATGTVKKGWRQGAP